MKRLLVVDDDADLREVIALALLPTGWTVTCAANGEEALTLATDVDGVLLDLEMPVLDGRATLTALHAAPTTADLPVVFLTAAAEPALTAELMALGALAVHAKPFNPLALGATLAQSFGWSTTTGPPPKTRAAG